MAWLCVNKDGQECIFKYKPCRDFEAGEWTIPSLMDDFIYLPKGSIKKLIGRNLTWNEVPVEIK